MNVSIEGYCIIESMIFSRIKIKNKMIMAFILAGVLFVGLLLFLRAQEDTWICQNGGWERHGVPSAPMPTSVCE